MTTQTIEFFKTKKQALEVILVTLKGQYVVNAMQ